jgi:bifunctional DNA-binding transcriptional regulator/antitoxin component of YhaV-PrlF toxin-antitoxin module
VGQRRQVVIPREMLESLHIQAGDFVAFAQRQDGALIKPKRVVDPDDILTAKESALVKTAAREMREGKFVTLAQLQLDLDRPRLRQRRKTAKAIPPDRRQRVMDDIGVFEVDPSGPSPQRKDLSITIRELALWSLRQMP